MSKKGIHIVLQLFEICRPLKDSKQHRDVIVVTRHYPRPSAAHSLLIYVLRSLSV